MTHVLATASVALGTLVMTAPEADAQVRIGRRGPVVVYAARPAVRFYARPRYVAPLIVAPLAAAPVYYYSRPRYTCAQLEFRCDRGDEWACGVLERDPGC
jgi:hypothetical protein